MICAESTPALSITCVTNFARLASEYSKPRGRPWDLQKRYSPERKAEFILSTATTVADYPEHEKQLRNLAAIRIRFRTDGRIDGPIVLLWKLNGQFRSLLGNDWRSSNFY